MLVVLALSDADVETISTGSSAFGGLVQRVLLIPEILGRSGFRGASGTTISI